MFYYDAAVQAMSTNFGDPYKRVYKIFSSDLIKPRRRRDGSSSVFTVQSRSTFL